MQAMYADLDLASRKLFEDVLGSLSAGQRLESAEVLKSLAASLDAERRESLKRDFIAYHAGFKSDLGVAMPRDYLVTIGTRK